MRRVSRFLALSAVVMAVLPLGTTAGAAVGYDLTNPASTRCVSKAPRQYPATVRTYGLFSIQLRSSQTCNTVWAYITRTDSKRCLDSGANCAQIRITRTLGNGTKTTTGWRRMPGGAKAVLSLQLNGINNAKYTASASTLRGGAIGTSGTISIDRNGKWTSS